LLCAGSLRAIRATVSHAGWRMCRGAHEILAIRLSEEKSCSRNEGLVGAAGLSFPRTDPRARCRMSDFFIVSHSVFHELVLLFGHFCHRISGIALLLAAAFWAGARSALNDFTARDEQMFQSSYLTRDIAEREGWFRVPSIEGAIYVNRQGVPGDYAGIILTYRRLPILANPNNIVLYQLRLDTLPTGKHFRYLQSSGSGNHFYYSCMIDPAWFYDLDVGITFVEGAKKCVALMRALLESVANGTGSRHIS
jgi:hypothetical protein